MFLLGQVVSQAVCSRSRPGAHADHHDVGPDSRNRAASAAPARVPACPAPGRRRRKGTHAGSRGRPCSHRRALDLRGDPSEFRLRQQVDAPFLAARHDESRASWERNLAGKAIRPFASIFGVYVPRTTAAGRHRLGCAEPWFIVGTFWSATSWTISAPPYVGYTSAHQWHFHHSTPPLHHFSPRNARFAHNFRRFPHDYPPQSLRTFSAGAAAGHADSPRLIASLVGLAVHLNALSF